MSDGDDVETGDGRFDDRKTIDEALRRRSSPKVTCNRSRDIKTTTRSR